MSIHLCPPPPPDTHDHRGGSAPSYPWPIPPPLRNGSGKPAHAGKVPWTTRKASESLERKKKKTFCKVFVIGGGGSEFRSKEEVICRPPAFHGDGKGRQKSPFSATHNGSLLSSTKPPSFPSKGPSDLPSVRLVYFASLPEGLMLLLFPEFSSVGPTANSGVCPLGDVLGCASRSGAGREGSWSGPVYGPAGPPRPKLEAHP